MSNDPSTNNSGHERSINLKLLGPAQELSPPGVQLTAIPYSTTIADLKSRIHETVPSHPPIGCLRIIYHGRACRDNERLGEIFARTSNSEESDFRVLHVVISDPTRARFPPVPQQIAGSQTGVHSNQSPSSTPVRQPTPASFETASENSHVQQQTAPQSVPHTHPNQHAHIHAQINPSVQPNGPMQYQHGQAAFNPAELMNGLLNQQFVGQHLAAVQAQLPQLLQNLPGMAFPPVMPGMAPAGPPMTVPPAVRESHVPQTAHQANVNMPAPPTTSTHNPASSAMSNSNSGTQPSQPNPESHVRLSSNLPQSGAQPPPPQPSSNSQQITSTDANGRQVTITVQNSVFNYEPGHLPPGLPNFAFGPPGQPSNLQPPLIAGPGVSFPRPSSAMQHGVRTPSPSNLSMSSMNAPANQSGHFHVHAPNRTIDVNQQMLFLSGELYNTSARIQALGGRIASLQARACIRPGVVRESISYLHAVDELENRLRFFDTQCAHAATHFPDIISNPQYLQTQTRRQGAGAALARIYEIIRNEVMTPTLPPSVVAPTSSPSPPRLGAQQPIVEQAATRSSSDLASTTVPPVPRAMPLTSNSPQLYILNDPRGTPYALLIGPNGQHSSQPLPWNVLQPLLTARLPAVTLARAIYHATNGAYSQTINSVRAHNTQGSRAASLAELRNLATFSVPRPGTQDIASTAEMPLNAAENLPNGPDAGPGQAGREPDEMRDVLAPIIRNLWLVLRIAGFAYFLFGGGRALWRPLILAAMMTVVWAAQAGIFGDRFDAIRRYLDRLVGIDHDQRQDTAGPAEGNTPEVRAGTAPQQRNASANDGAGAQRGPNNSEPRPEAAASRLIAQQQQQLEQTWLVQQVRYVERMLGLFLASLWPGIGEQAVRLQEERERRSREAQQALDAERRAEEEARQSAEASKLTEGGAAEVVHTSDPAAPKQESSAPTTSITESSDSITSGADIAPTEGSSTSRVNKGKERAIDQ